MRFSLLCFLSLAYRSTGGREPRKTEQRYPRGGRGYGGEASSKSGHDPYHSFNRETRNAHRRQGEILQEARRLQEPLSRYEEATEKGRNRAKRRAERAEQILGEKQVSAQVRRNKHLASKVRMMKSTNASPLARALSNIGNRSGPPPGWQHLAPVRDGHMLLNPRRQVPIQQF